MMSKMRKQPIDKTPEIMEYYRTNPHFREAADALHKLQLAGMSDQALYWAARMAMELTAMTPIDRERTMRFHFYQAKTVNKGNADQPLDMELTAHDVTVALASIPVLWRIRHDSRDGAHARHALRGWIDVLKRERRVAP